MEPWRPLALAAALTVTVAVGGAAAQTVIVTNAPPGSTIELALNAATIGSATVEPGGNATLALDLSKHGGKTETAAHIFVDVCDRLRRVLVVEPGQQPPPLGVACARKEFAGLFVVRRVTTLVVDVAENRPAVWLRQGPAPAEWLTREAEGVRPAKVGRPSPKGLVLFGGGGLVEFRDAVALACGNVTECAGKLSRGAYTGGVAYWFTRFLAAEASYVRPADVTANGSGDTYRFNSSLDTHILTFAGKVGVPIGRVRLYGQAGVNYHRATSSTTETIDDSTVTIDDVTETIKGGTQTFELRTAGWGWLFGGGGEIWVAPRLAIFGEAGHARLKGTTLDEGEGEIDDRVTFILVGARFHIGR